MDAVDKIQKSIGTFLNKIEPEPNFSITSLVMTANFQYLGNTVRSKEKKQAIADFILHLICRDEQRYIEASDMFIRACMSQKDLLHFAYENTDLACTKTLEDVLLKCIAEGTAVGAQKVLMALNRDMTETELRALYRNWKNQKRSNEEASVIRAFSQWFPDSLLRQAILNETKHKPMIYAV